MFNCFQGILQGCRKVFQLGVFTGAKPTTSLHPERPEHRESQAQVVKQVIETRGAL